MQSNRTPRKGPKFLDAKVLIAALSVAITFGFWNLFSSNAIQANKTGPSVTLTLPPQPATDTSQDYPPLPTLVPLVEVNFEAQPQQVQAPVQAGGVVPVVNNAQPAAGKQAVTLRSVAVPTTVVVQKNKPQIGAVASSNTGGDSSSSSSGGGGKSKPAAVTKSSK
jgi:hypothetical protein